MEKKDKRLLLIVLGNEASSKVAEILGGNAEIHGYVKYSDNITIKRLCLCFRCSAENGFYR